VAEPQVRSLPVPDGLEGERLDAGLSRLLGLPRSRVAELAAEGRVSLDGAPAAKSERLRAGSWLEVELPAPPAPSGLAGPSGLSGPSGGPSAPTEADRLAGLGVVHDDDDLVVVDKPVGVAAHPSPGWTGPTVVGALAAAGYRVSTSGAAERQGVVHRLDVGTSGLMVVAKTEQAYSALKEAFRERTVEKTYHALVQGHPDPSAGTVDAPIGRHPGADHRFAVVAGGRDSVTHYETLEAFAAASLLRVRLETGRTHQIRVHFSALRHPCVGDLTYGADPRLAERLGVTRQWLHAMALGFTHPGTGERVRYESTYPADLAGALERLAD
jgi:23S rRNA pseudouridine1911/1915/1917 synthase